MNRIRGTLPRGPSERIPEACAKPFHRGTRAGSTVCRGLGVLVVMAALFAPSARADRLEDEYRKQRLLMVENVIASEGIKNKLVLDAMRTVPRHEFVLPADRPKAYFDQSLSIGHKQTITPPFIVAYMTETLDPQPTDRVLEIGTGSGYQAAILAQIVKEVYTIEIVEPLGKQAQERLARMKYRNIEVKIGDGYKGWPEHAPFDKIIVTCSPEAVPQPLIDQLKDGGRMIVPLGERYQQVFHLFEKRDGKLIQTKLLPTLFVPMTGASEEERKVKPDPLKPQMLNASFEESTLIEGMPDGWHYLRQVELVASQNAPDGKRFLLISNREPGRFAQGLQATAVDGSRIGKLKVTCWVRATDILPGPEARQLAGIQILFYDSDRRLTDTVPVAAFEGTFPWKKVSQEIVVPKSAREMILHFGLNGGTGKLSLDALQVAPVARN